MNMKKNNFNFKVLRDQVKHENTKEYNEEEKVPHSLRISNPKNCSIDRESSEDEVVAGQDEFEIKIIEKQVKYNGCK